MFRSARRQAVAVLLILSIFCFQNVFSETGGLRDRPVSVVFVCEPSSKADKPRFYKSTSLFFKRLKNKRAQENGTAFLVGYGSFASEIPSEQLNLAAQNGYDLYIFPKNITENLPSSANKTLPWIAFASEKKVETSKPTNIPPKSKKSSSKSKKKKTKPKKANVAKDSPKTQTNSTSVSKPVSTSVPTSTDSKTKTKESTPTNSNVENKEPDPKESIPQKSSENAASKKKNVKTKNKTSKTKKNQGNSTAKKSAKRTEPSKDSSSETKNSMKENSDPKKNESSSFELQFDSLKFWFSTLTNAIEFPWESDKILFLTGDQTAEEWSSAFSGKTEEATLIRLLNSPQDLKFNEGIYYTGCASPGIPNGVSVLNFFFRGNRLIRLKQESFSLNSDGSGKSWELE
ncbi:LIC11612 family fibronectin-binding protein [Leptospira kmetyi]|uniref:Uncharacterized protein n=1 Tax=Leptospira kmetyi TaxID=408139 RepID=A0AAD0UMY9_9LEPT|nr:hypothetical protein [Leptospira kmetyi]AYV54435.1 hypothetical protein EFP84_02210 [Leptospira kmetyi]EQA52329.1 hypothetical protein LEP1GSC052_1142 [Leptospira kmetyi serovar Malaysia str. Bejo-Iso9]